MSDCLATLDSGNYAYALVTELEKDGHCFKVMPTPCRISRTGCGYCIKFPEEKVPILMAKSKEKKFYIREIYRMVPQLKKTEYVRIYPSS